MVVDLPNSAVAFAAADIARDENKVMIGSGAGSSALTGPRCSPNTVPWTDDTDPYGQALGRTVHEQGGRNRFFVTADDAFGHDLEKQAADALVARGGKVVGTVRHPINALGAATDGRAVVEAMKAMPTDDPLFGKGTIRADGRTMHPLYLLQVKQPSESKGGCDVMKVVGTIRAEDAFRPLAAGGCPLVK